MTMGLDGPRVQLLTLAVIDIATGVAIAIETTVLRGVLSAALLLALAALLYWGRERFDVINVMSGSGDERTRTLYTRASAFMGTVLASVITVWWLVTGISGEVNETLTVLTAVGAASFVAGAILASKRG